MATDEHAGRRPRQQAKRATRAALLEAGLHEFLERGLDAPSLDAICARAGKTRGAFYVHFKDREDFLIAVMEWVLASFLDSVIATEAGGHDLDTTISRFLEALAAGAIPFSVPGKVRVNQVLEVAVRSAAVRDRFAKTLGEAIDRIAAATERGQVARAVRTDIDARALAGVLLAAAVGLVQLDEAGISLDLDAAREAVLTLLAAR